MLPADAQAARHHHLQDDFFQKQLDNNPNRQTVNSQAQTGSGANTVTVGASGAGAGNFQSVFQNLIAQLQQLIQQLLP